MSREARERKKRQMNQIISFLLSTFLFTAISISLFYFGFLSPDTIKTNLSDSNYYVGMENLIISGAEDILLPTGLPPEVLNNVIDRSTVHQDIRTYLEGEFSGQRHVVNIESMNHQLRINIEDYLGDREVSSEAIDEIINALTSHYANLIAFPFLSQIVRISHIFQWVMRVFVVGGIILTLLTSLFISRMNRWKHRTYRYLAYGIGGSGLMLLIGPAILKWYEPYARVSIRPDFVYNFIVLHIERGLNLFMISGGIAIGIATLLALMSLNKVRKLKKSSKKK